MYITLLLLLLTGASAYPIPQLLFTGPHLTKTEMILQDIQIHYENLVDQVISTHNEDLLFSLTPSVQAVADPCLCRVPHWIGKVIHEAHAKIFSSVGPLVQDYMERHWPSVEYQDEITPIFLEEWLIQFNHDLRSKLYLMDPNGSDLVQRLKKCHKGIDPSVLVEYLIKMNKEMAIQLYEQVPHLVQLIQEDLHDDLLDD